MTIIDVEQTIIWDAERDIIKVCAPLLDRFGIRYFDYARFYRDNTMFTLVTDRVWAKSFFNDPDYQPPATWVSEGYHLWSSYIPEHFLQQAQQDFGILHGVTIVKHYPEYQQVINFSAAPDKIDVLGLYLNHQSVLESFIRYFEQQAKPFIDKAEQSRIILPPSVIEGHDVLTAPNYDDFLYDIANQQSYFIMVDNKRIVLTNREAQCLYHLHDGKSMKMIARDLGISPRTVECYVNNLRSKTNAITRYNLLDKIQNKDDVESWCW